MDAGCFCRGMHRPKGRSWARRLSDRFGVLQFSKRSDEELTADTGSNSSPSLQNLISVLMKGARLAAWAEAQAKRKWKHSHSCCPCGLDMFCPRWH